MQPDNFLDVQRFHVRFGVGPHLPTPHLPSHSIYKFRLKFLQEELKELEDAYAENDLPKYFDALLDLVYVALGTADLSSLPWQQGWDEVQRANMSKIRAGSVEESLQATGRGHRLDVIKPPGWTPPDLRTVLIEAGWSPK